MPGMHAIILCACTLQKGFVILTNIVSPELQLWFYEILE